MTMPFRLLLAMLALGQAARSAEAPASAAPSASRPASGGRGGSGPQPTSFDGFVQRATAKVAWSQEIGRIEAGGAVAVFTALKIQDGAQSAAGVRVELTRPGVRDEVYLGPDEIRTVLTGIGGLVAGLPDYLAKVPRNAAGGSYYGAPQFWMPSLQILNVARYERGGEVGVALGAFRGANGYYHFPGQDPETVRAMVEKARLALESQPSTPATR